MDKIVFLDAATVGRVEGIEKLEHLGKLDIYENTTPEQVVERCKRKNIVITNKVEFNENVMNQLPDLKLICVTATGMNNIDLEAAEKLKIRVKNVTGYSTNSVAQLTFSVLLYLINHPWFFDKYVKSGAYSKSDMFTYHGNPFWELKGKRMGIIGLGTIGVEVARIAEAFGMEVVFFSTSGKNDNTRYKRFELNDLLRTSDVVSIHAPLNARTKGLITYEKLKLLRPSAILINMGRGGIVVEKDLAKGLDDNLLAGAALDVFENEPIPSNNPLLRINQKDKLILTPHIAWASREARELLISKIVKNIENFQSADKLTN